MTFDIHIESKYLNIPVQSGAPACLMSIWNDDQLVRQFQVELAPSGKEDFWAFTDLGEFQGLSLRLTVQAPNGKIVPEFELRQTDKIIEDEPLYQERLRPQFHFSSRRGWLNDPNGLVYYDGSYHLFYQHNPYGIKWGNMHWGHAVSRDLIHWTELGEALYPDEMGTMFSGSAIVDARNTAGFKTGDDDPIVLFYTAAGASSMLSEGRRFTQCIAYSNDRGKSWTKYHGNPIVDHIAGDNRDPKIVWHEATQKWIMVLYLEGNEFTILGSSDLKSWTRLSDLTIPDCDECPDLFPLPLDGDPTNIKWIFWGANGSYLVGDFDGEQFHVSDHVRTRSTVDASYYAAQTWSNTPDGRCIQIAWFQCDLHKMPFNHFMTFPCELSLSSTPEGPRLMFHPIKEIESLHDRKLEMRPQTISATQSFSSAIEGDLLDINLRIQIDQDHLSEIELLVGETPIRYSVTRQEISCNGKFMQMKLDRGGIELRILVDRASVEIFGNGGAVYMPVAVPGQKGRWLSVSATGNDVQLTKLQVHTLKSTWIR